MTTPPARRRVPDAVLRFDFVGHGQTVPAGATRRDRLWLDAGNALGPGIIDHHHLAAYTGSTTSLVLQHPDLVWAALNPRRRKNDPFTLLVHADPDLDCLASAYVAGRLVTTGEFPPEAATLARYVDAVDQGHLGASQDAPFSLYAAWLTLAARLGDRSWHAPADLWREQMRQGFVLLGFVLDTLAAQGRSLPEVDAFDCPGLFGAADRREIVHDIERYRRKLADPATRARILQLWLPGYLGGHQEVDALLVRNVQRADDAERPRFFKDWARTDRGHSPGGRGFVALSVFEDRPSGDRTRTILSVRPDAGVTLRGLADLLDQAEAEERVRRQGVDDRVTDPATGSARAPRPGYRNADPWYDGRAHGYTIVDAPHGGSVLDAETVEALFARFGRRTDAEVSPLVLPSRADTGSGTLDGAALGLLSFTANAARAEPARPAIFISYAHARAAWVRTNLYEPLVARCGRERVFFDADSLSGGAGWLATLAAAVGACRAFVAVYSAEYFRSDFCQWELQLALARDPIGRKGIVLPLMLEPVTIPAYCALIQAADATQPGAAERLLRSVEQAVTHAA